MQREETPEGCKPWFVVQSKPGQEIKAWVGVAEQGFETFFPSLTKEIRHARRVEKVVRPLFPCYLFVTFDLADPWGPILHTRGVQTILGVATAGQPVRTPWGFVEMLSGQARAGHFTQGAAPIERFAAGEKVKIMQGPFTGFEAIVDIDERQRVKVLLDFLGTQTPISLQREAVGRL